jgi:deazaflavin-dependent oxidoreductase (nitroreductase family)
MILAHLAMLPAVLRRSVTRWLLRAPAGLYSVSGGWLLGHRFMLLTHRGRRTGRLYKCVLEVLAWRPDTCEAIVLSGWRSAWYRNVLAGGAVEVAIGHVRFSAQGRVLDLEEGATVLADYERRHRIARPLIRRLLSKLTALPYDGSLSARRSVIRVLPVVGFRPAQSCARDEQPSIA